MNKVVLCLVVLGLIFGAYAGGFDRGRQAKVADISRQVNEYLSDPDVRLMLDAKKAGYYCLITWYK